MGAVIAVDGPAGSGKSSVCRGAAARLGYRYLDTGAMYRAMTFAVLDAGIDPTDADAVASFSSTPIIESGSDPQRPSIEVNGHDVAVPIRGEEVTAAVSAVSAVPQVRERLVAIQRATTARAAADGVGIVVEGRDITTVVLPHADVKIFLTADPEVRAARRAKESGTVDDSDVRRTAAAIAERDAHDASRAASPLTQAGDATVVDTTHLTLDEVIERVCAMAEAAQEATSR